MKISYWKLSLLFITLVSERVLSNYLGWWNLVPITPLVFMGGLMFSQSWAVLIPILSLGLSDVLLNIHLGIDPYSVLSVRNLLLLIPFWVGVILARKGETGAKTLLLSTVGNTVVFYLLSNTYSWATDTFYQKSLSGWTLALTVGYPQFPPTWEFGLRSLTGDLAFMGVVVAFRLKFFEKEDKRQFA